MPSMVENLAPYLKQLESSLGQSKIDGGNRNHFDMDASEEGEVNANDLRFVTEQLISQDELDRERNQLSDGEIILSNPSNAFEID